MTSCSECSSGGWSQASGQSPSSTAGTTGTKPSSTNTDRSFPDPDSSKNTPNFSTATSVTSMPSDDMNTQKPSRTISPGDLGQIELDFESIRQLLIEAYDKYDNAHKSGDRTEAMYWDGAIRMAQRIVDLQGQ